MTWHAGFQKMGGRSAFRFPEKRALSHDNEPCNQVLTHWHFVLIFFSFFYHHRGHHCHYCHHCMALGLLRKRPQTSNRNSNRNQKEWDDLYLMGICGTGLQNALVKVPLERVSNSVAYSSNRCDCGGEGLLKTQAWKSSLQLLTCHTGCLWAARRAWEPRSQLTSWAQISTPGTPALASSLFSLPPHPTPIPYPTISSCLLFKGSVT